MGTEGPTVGNLRLGHSDPDRTACVIREFLKSQTSTVIVDGQRKFVVLLDVSSLGTNGVYDSLDVPLYFLSTVEEVSLRDFPSAGMFSGNANSKVTQWILLGMDKSKEKRHTL